MEHKLFEDYAGLIFKQKENASECSDWGQNCLTRDEGVRGRLEDEERWSPFYSGTAPLWPCYLALLYPEKTFERLPGAVVRKALRGDINSVRGNKDNHAHITVRVHREMVLSPLVFLLTLQLFQGAPAVTACG